ncbi:ribonuclease H-like domain-containing protein [Tanacetum coccineum]
MSVHNSLHNSPANSNDTTALIIVSIKLKGTENYQVWSCAMLLALERKNKIGFIDGTCKRSNTDEILGKQWDKKQYDVMIELPKCVCNAFECFKKHNQLLKLMQFLMGLDDSYMQIRSSILSREVLPDVRSAYATISSEESHRVVAGFSWLKLGELRCGRSGLTCIFRIQDLCSLGGHRDWEFHRSVGHKEYQMGLLRAELEKVKQEKEGFEFKIAKFDKSAKDLNEMLESQITTDNKSKKGSVVMHAMGTLTSSFDS